MEEEGPAPLLDSVNRTVAALKTTESDAAAVHLAQLYAVELDRAAEAERTAAEAVELAAEEGRETLIPVLRALQAKLAEREALDRIGARLTALLVELRATPKARGKTPTTSSGKLAGLRVAK